MYIYKYIYIYMLLSLLLLLLLLLLLVVGCWLLFVGCWLLVVGCWLLVAVVVELFYSLKRILLLGGLNHAPARWLERYSNLLRLLSSRLDKTSDAQNCLFLLL